MSKSQAHTHAIQIPPVAAVWCIFDGSFAAAWCTANGARSAGRGAGFRTTARRGRLQRERLVVVNVKRRYTKVMKLCMRLSLRRAGQREASRTKRGLTFHNPVVPDTVHRGCQASQDRRGELWKSLSVLKRKTQRTESRCWLFSLASLTGPSLWTGGGNLFRRETKGNVLEKHKK